MEVDAMNNDLMNVRYASACREVRELQLTSDLCATAHYDKLNEALNNLRQRHSVPCAVADGLDSTREGSFGC